MGVESEILITQTCTPTAENVCSTETVETEEIEYEKVCKDVVDVLCDAGHGYHALTRETLRLMLRLILIMLDSLMATLPPPLWLTPLLLLPLPTLPPLPTLLPTPLSPP